MMRAWPAQGGRIGKGKVHKQQDGLSLFSDMVKTAAVQHMRMTATCVLYSAFHGFASGLQVCD